MKQIPSGNWWKNLRRKKMSLRGNFLDKVCNGNDLFQMLVSTATGTGLGTATYKLGQCCLDQSSGDWFLCTATTGGGTWVKINA